MSKKNLFLIISGCLVVMFVLFISIRYAKKAEATGGEDMFAQIDDKAAIAQNGSQAAVSDLVNTIFTENGLGDLDPNLAAALQDRIVRAEMNGQTISDAQIVGALNWLASQMSAPSFAQTSQLQTRVTRVEMNKYMPNLFVDKDTQGNKTTNRAAGSNLSGQVSPSQATCLLLILMQQKMLNQDYQVTPAEWESNFYVSQQTESGGSSSSGPPTLAKKTNTQKSDQMYQIIYNSNFSASAIENLAHGVLDNLGIPR